MAEPEDLISLYIAHCKSVAYGSLIARAVNENSGMYLFKDLGRMITLAAIGQSRIVAFDRPLTPSYKEGEQAPLQGGTRSPRRFGEGTGVRSIRHPALYPPAANTGVSLSDISVVMEKRLVESKGKSSTLGEYVVTPSPFDFAQGKLREGSAFPDTEFEKADSSLRSE